MIYGLVTEKVKHHQRKLQKLVLFKDFKNLNVESLKDNLTTAPWHLGEMFEFVDDRYYFWTTKYDMRWTYASKKDENEGKRCALYDTSLDETYQSKVSSFFETI